MAQIITYDADRGLREGIATAGSALASALATRGQRKYEEERRQQLRQEEQQEAQRQGTVLQSVMQNLPQDASPMQRVMAFNQAMSEGVPMETIYKLGTLQTAMEKAQATGQGSGLGVENKSQLMDVMKRFGMDENQAEREADLYLSLPTGGRTAYANMFFDRMQRGGFSGTQPQSTGTEKDSAIFNNVPGEIMEQTDVLSSNRRGDVSSTSEEVAGFQWPKLNTFEGLTPKERTTRQKDLFNANAKDFQENKTKQMGYEDELRRLGSMATLNDSGKLPEGLQNLNINWTTGDIKFPRLANPETQLFVKSVNDFTTKAKDTYGSRVTNFELGTFMRRLPTLANSEEGRRLILAQMSAQASLNKLYHDSLNEVYDKYGLRNIDVQQAEKIAKELRKDDEAALLQDYKQAMQAQEVYEARQLAPANKMPARAPDGRIVYIWTDQLDKAQKKGYKPL